MSYSALLRQLRACGEESLRAFNAKIFCVPQEELIGVRTPRLRALAKEYREKWEELLTYPDEFYEVTFIKCNVLGMQPYGIFTANLGKLLPSLTNWALTDCFLAPCVKGKREDFLRYIRAYRFSPHPFVSRFALVQLLRYYCDEAYLPFLFESAEGCDHTEYYVSMAAAWLMAEVLVKHFEIGFERLKEGTMPAITHNRTIQKACESSRLSAEQKSTLRSLKRTL